MNFFDRLTAKVKKRILAHQVTLIILLAFAVASSGVVLAETATNGGCFCTPPAAMVNASPLGCNSINDSCDIVLTNNGNVNVSVQACAVGPSLDNANYGNLKDGSGALKTIIPLPAGTGTKVICQVPGEAAPGQTIQGEVIFNNGATADFSGTWD